MNRPRSPRCMNSHCKSMGKAPAEYRGLCDACYRALGRLLKKNGMTFDDAVAAGKCRRSKEAGESRFPDFGPVLPNRASSSRVMEVPSKPDDSEMAA